MPANEQGEGWILQPHESQELQSQIPLCTTYDRPCPGDNFTSILDAILEDVLQPYTGYEAQCLIPGASLSPAVVQQHQVKCFNQLFWPSTSMQNSLWKEPVQERQTALVSSLKAHLLVKRLRKYMLQNRGGRHVAHATVAQKKKKKRQQVLRGLAIHRAKQTSGISNLLWFCLNSLQQKNYVSVVKKREKVKRGHFPIGPIHLKNVEDHCLKTFQHHALCVIYHT